MAPLVLFGGTFDPPHNGHLLAVECARVHFGAGQAVLMPAGISYHKQVGNPDAFPAQVAERRHVPSPAKHRLGMLRAAAESNPHFIVDEREIHRDGPTYTIDTLEDLRSEPAAAGGIVLLLGADSLADFWRWRAPERILELAIIAVVPKPGVNREPEKAVPHEPVPMPALPISSTLIRDRVAASLPVRYLVPDAVAEYIEREGLYQGE